RLVGFRDLSGARPFFYSCRPGKLSFSNTLQAVLADREVSRGEFDFQFLADFLLGLPHYDAERCIYRCVRRLPQGHLLEFSSQGVAIKQIASLPIEEPVRLEKEDLVSEFRGLFSKSVRERLPPSETAILLSGGLDSTSIAATAVGERRRLSSNLN